jgi:hypothetical protein
VIVFVLRYIMKVKIVKQVEARKKMGRPSKGDLARVRYLVLRLSMAEMEAVKSHFKTSTAVREYVLEGVKASDNATPAP